MMEWWVLPLAAVGVWLVWLSRRRPKMRGGAGFMVVRADPSPPPSGSLKILLTLLGFGVLAWWTYYILIARSHG